MARIAGIDLPKDKRIEIGLTYIYGIGRKSAQEILAQTGVNPDTRVKDLTDADEAKLREAIDHSYIVEGDLRRQARQLVSHAHFTVNGKKVNIPSYLVKAGDVIEVAESSRSSEVFKRLMGQDAPVFLVPTWMERDKNSLKGTVVRLPAREEIDVPVEEHLIVELYSK